MEKLGPGKQRQSFQRASQHFTKATLDMLLDVRKAQVFLGEFLVKPWLGTMCISWVDTKWV
jgi:hypothetical protein